VRYALCFFLLWVFFIGLFRNKHHHAKAQRRKGKPKAKSKILVPSCVWTPSVPGGFYSLLRSLRSLCALAPLRALRSLLFPLTWCPCIGLFRNKHHHAKAQRRKGKPKAKSKILVPSCVWTPSVPGGFYSLLRSLRSLCALAPLRALRSLLFPLTWCPCIGLFRNKHHHAKAQRRKGKPKAKPKILAPWCCTTPAFGGFHALFCSLSAFACATIFLFFNALAPLCEL